MDLSLPAELSCTPLALVSFVGLDIQGNDVHDQVWRRFVVDRGLDRVAITFRRSDQLQWPQMKPKRNTYEWFIPKGILKKNW